MFALSSFVVFLFEYSKTTDYMLFSNIYGYDENSFAVLKKSDLQITSYNEFIDCNATSDDFDVENFDVYKSLSVCTDVRKVNRIASYYDLSAIKDIYLKEFDYNLLVDENKDVFLNIISDPKYKANNLKRYLLYDNNKQVMNVNLNYDLPMYTNYEIVNKFSQTMIVNPYNKLNNVYNNLFNCNNKYFYNVEMCNNYTMLENALAFENISFNVTKAFDGSSLFDEHATGLAFDFESDSKMVPLIESVASDYGFILRYKAEYEDVIKYSDGKFHFRYVGNRAKEIFESNQSLDEFLYINS